MSQRLFGPDSMTWRITRESILLLGGRATLLMQLAHPLVAAGVAHHSNFRADPLKRLRRTLDAMYEIVSGDAETARVAAAKVNAVHDRVRGIAPGGHPYDARDSELLLWVHSTLVDGALRVYEACVETLSPVDRDQYVHESNVIARLFGIPEELLPSSADAMRTWMRTRIDSGEVAVTPLARELAEPILRPISFVPRRLALASAFVTAALLPPEIRAGYGLRLGYGRSVLVAAGGATSRRVLPRLPRAVREFRVLNVLSRVSVE